MTDEQEQALEVVKARMASLGYKHGPCLGITRQIYKCGVCWAVELAQPGYETRSETCDPPSIILIAHVPSGTVETEMEMWGR